MNSWANGENPCRFIHILYKPWVLVSELGQREGECVGVLGLGGCRGLMEEFRLLRRAFGAPELAREWAAAPRKPEENRKQGEKGEMNKSVVGPVKAQSNFSS